IKSVVYSLLPAYPNLEYIVLVGDDRIIPHRRIRDDALVANERNYAAIAASTEISGSLDLRYFLTDDYYAAPIPFPFKDREFYLPQYGIGRLVENPAEILGVVDSFLSQPVLEPKNALVTGYDFLLDQAAVITNTMLLQGIDIENSESFINNGWTAADFRNELFTRAVAPDLISLNSHFEHYRFFPFAPPDVFATEIVSATDYEGTVVFTVGCHSGLNIPDGAATNDWDWAQAFSAQQASLFGNTGYGYGDSDLVAYSEALVANYVNAMGNWSEGPQTVGQAMRMAKQQYYNQLAGGSFSNYDEKVLEEMTLYGLPMLRVNMPVTTTTSLWGKSAMADVPVQRVEGGSLTATSLNFNFAFDQHTILDSSNNLLGNYYTLVGKDDVYVAGGKPIQPLSSASVSQSGNIAHGALMVGGSFTEIPNFNPAISQLITEEVGILPEEPLFPLDYWYPVALGSINRYLSIDGESVERLVMIPGQFSGTGGVNQTIGTQRLYNNLQFEVYHTPFESEDFIAPSIWNVWAERVANQVTFHVQVTDDSGAMHRVVMLYRELPSTTWKLAELTYDPQTQVATGLVSVPMNTEIEYFAQAVDPSGNVSVALSYGVPYFASKASPAFIYLPVAIKP
ncbi:MAG: hypothetical protein KC434_16805, partial [Anaerolineales bacterium]|nr:hypothetical protein [Anaerolineales bacterium]